MRRSADKKNQYLSGLLYYDLSNQKYAALRKGLKEYKFLLQISSIALSNFQNGEFEKFDSLVGENACQIRAIKIALIASKNSYNFDDVNQKIIKLLEKVNELLSDSLINSNMHQGYSLNDLINKYELDVLLSSDEMFVIQSYLLSEMKECQPNTEFMISILRKERCSPSTLQKKYPEVSYSFLEKTAKKLRKLLSISSVEFVRKAASDLQDPNSIKMVADDFALEHNTLSCVPTFWSFKTLFSLAQKEMIPLIFHVKFLDQTECGFRVVDEEFLYFKQCQITKSYVEAESVDKDLLLPTCVIQGVVCPKEGQILHSKQEWKEKFKKNSVIDMVLAMGADHRQYPNPDQTIAVRNREFDHYKTFAKRKGFSLSNPTTFFVQHIYCSQVIRTMPHLADCLSV